VVCHRDRLDSLTNPSLAPAGSPHHRLAGLLDGQEILTYGGGELAIDHTSGTAAVVPYP